MAEGPIALVEVQGYVYAAWLGIADLCERVGEQTKADDLKENAKQLRERFNRDFWMEAKGCYALALQKDGRPAAVVSSNPGQALWTGIADHHKAHRTIDRLMATDMFSGWGVRTLSAEERAYNPIAYHLGTVWPHDNAILAAGFRQYGRDDEALRIFQGLSDAAFHFPAHQLPEVFCGFSQREYKIPVNYPVACHPQAWAAGALPFLVTTLLGLEPDAFGKRLRIARPILPKGLDRLDVKGLRVGQSSPGPGPPGQLNEEVERMRLNKAIIGFLVMMPLLGTLALTGCSSSVLPETLKAKLASSPTANDHLAAAMLYENKARELEAEADEYEAAASKIENPKGFHRAALTMAAQQKRQEAKEMQKLYALHSRQGKVQPEQGSTR